MFLSRIGLDESRRETVGAIAAPGILHGAVERCFPFDGRPRRLWRIDRTNGVTYLMILSQDRPDMSHIAAQFGFCGDTGETKDYSSLLDRIEVGQVWRFRLRANPIHNAKLYKGKRGRIYAHVTQDQQKEWLKERAEGLGFALTNDSFDVVHTQWHSFKKKAGGKSDVTLRTAAFEGFLTVTDSGLFKRTLTEGVGRAKAYGCGLLTVMRP